MKKTLLFAGIIAAPISMAAAKPINFDTPVEWNSKVIEQALNKAGFIGDSGANWDVRVTHDRILTELLNRKSVSLKDALHVCLNKCNMSDFLKNGRGASGKKCSELCNEFTNVLTSVNNSSKSAGKGTGNSAQTQPDGTIKVWSADKKYYALYGTEPNKFQKTHSSLKKYNGTCNWHDNNINGMYEPLFVAFDAKSNKPIALLGLDTADKAYNLLPLCAIDGYKNLKFSASHDSSYKPTKFIVSGNIDTANRQSQTSTQDKIYSKDNKYYALMTNNISKYRNICGDFDNSDIIGVVFISQSNTPIGYLGYHKTDNNIPSLCVKREYEKKGNKCIYFGIYGHSWSLTTDSIRFKSTKNLYLEYGYNDNCDHY
ncbi:hypothetical protein HDR66_00760 [bacterium]|nr:hypothetical protein [bacterium]